MYVDDDAPPGGDGQTWKTAYRFLQDGLIFAANPANGVTEVRVAQGVYKPDRNEAAPAGTGDRTASFGLNNGVALRGGYRGLNNDRLDADAREFSAFETVLNGDLTGNDGPPGSFENYLDNSLNVVKGLDLDQTALLEGFTITAGCAATDVSDASEEGGFPETGAGCLAYGEPTIRHCRFEFNFANLYGGGLILSSNNPVEISDCVFVKNRAGVIGGGAWIGGSIVRVSRCTFSENDAGGNSDGLVISGESGTTISNCRFFRHGGAGIYFYEGGGLVEHSLIVANSRLGRAIHSWHSGPIIVTSCTIVSEGIPFDGWFELHNCVIATDAPAMLGALDIWYSLVPKTYSGQMSGVIHGDPKFVDIDGADDILGNEDDDLRLRAGSLCIDSGDSSAVPAGVTLDLNDQPRFVDDPDTPDTGVGPPPIVDMGAFEYQPGCDADVIPLLTGNGVIDIDDLLFIINAWGWSGQPSTNAADITGNGVVDIDDLLEIINSWGPCPQ